MVWLEIEKDGKKRIMIDGYMPSFHYLKHYIPSLRHKKTRPNPEGDICMFGLDSWSGFYRYLRKKDISENHLLKLFEKTVDVLRIGFCPEKRSVEIRDGDYNKMVVPSRYAAIGTTTKRYDVGRQILSNIRRKNPQGFLTLKEECLHDIRNAKKGYVQNLITIEFNGDYLCGGLENLCCKNWIDKLKFRIKKESEYNDYKDFKNVWLEFMRIS